MCNLSLRFRHFAYLPRGDLDSHAGIQEKLELSSIICNIELLESYRFLPYAATFNVSNSLTIHLAHPQYIFNELMHVPGRLDINYLLNPSKKEDCIQYYFEDVYVSFVASD